MKISQLACHSREYSSGNKSITPQQIMKPINGVYVGWIPPDSHLWEPLFRTIRDGKEYKNEKTKAYDPTIARCPGLETENLLLGLIQEPEQLVGEIFAHFGVELIAVREKVMQLSDEKIPEISSSTVQKFAAMETNREIRRILEQISKVGRGRSESGGSSLEGDKDTLALLRSIDTKVLRIEQDFNDLRWDLIVLRDRIERGNNGIQRQ